MNKNRRIELRNWVKKAADWVAHGEELKDALENICSDEQDYFDNMPENLQSSMRAEESEEAIDYMENAIEMLESAVEELEGIN